jgi:hypothetical protein
MTPPEAEMGLKKEFRHANLTKQTEVASRKRIERATNPVLFSTARQ